jgi:putative methyltransferase
MFNIYLVQPNYPAIPGGDEEYYLPYSVGVLWASAIQSKKIKDNYFLKKIIFKREPINKLIENIENPSVAIFSCYVWNWEYNKKLAKKLKEVWPKCKIIFGGPQVTDQPFKKLFFHHHKYVDYVVNGEGELVIKEILEALLDQTSIERIHQQPRLQNLEELPSPYLTGIFDDIISDNPDIKWHAVFETNRGCPYACTYCDWGSATYSKIKKFDINRVMKEIDWFGKHKIEYLFIADANFGIYPERDREIAQALANTRETNGGYPKIINANWQKNSTTNSVDIAKILGTRGFTVSAQSMDLSVLKAVKRDNMKINNLRELFSYCQKKGVPTYTDMILGMPNETLESWKSGLLSLLDYGQHDMIVIYFTQLLENAEMMKQLDEFDIKFVKTDNWDTYYTDHNLDQDPVREYKLVVNSTSTMNCDDMVKSVMFSWLITIFHSFGYTQAISIYLHKKGLMSYAEFYDLLENYILTSTGLFNKEYKRVKKAAEEYLSKGYYDYDKAVMKYLPGETLIWSSLFYLPRSNKDLVNDLTQFVSSKISKKISQNEGKLEALVSYQTALIIDYDKKYPITTSVPNEIYNVLNEKEIDSDIELRLDINPQLKNLDIDDFCTAILVKKRSSLHKLVIEEVGSLHVN